MPDGFRLWIHMKILEKVFYRIVSATPQVPPETGGILGGKDGIVTCFQFDQSPTGSGKSLTYYPNTRYLERAISLWQESGVEFYGIYHSHRTNDRQLSAGDKQYITTIMLAMPLELNTLYFPIVLPRETILVYRADRCVSNVHIVREEIEII